MPKSKEFISESDTDSSDEENQWDINHVHNKKYVGPYYKEELELTIQEVYQPKPKKKKTEKKVEKKPEKTESPKKPAGGAEKGPGGEMMFQLARMRYATVSEFRGKVMVGIREFYEKDGEMRPGKKGISLPMDQWKRLKEQIDDIDQAIKDLS